MSQIYNSYNYIWNIKVFIALFIINFIKIKGAVLNNFLILMREKYRDYIFNNFFLYYPLGLSLLFIYINHKILYFN